MGEGCEGGEEQVAECSSEGEVSAAARVVWQWGGDMCICGMGPLDMHVVGEGDEEWGVERTGVV